MNMNFKKHLCWAAAVLLISVVVFSGIMQARAVDAPFADMYDSNEISPNSSLQLEQYTANTPVSAGDGLVDRFIRNGFNTPRLAAIPLKSFEVEI